MTFRHLLSPLLLASALLGTTACDSSEGKAKGHGEKPLNTLSQVEIQDVCEELLTRLDLDAMFVHQRTVGCYSHTPVDATCEDSVEECLAEIGPNPGLSCEDAEVLPNCRATVNELFDCYEDIAEATAKLADGLTCANAETRIQQAEDQIPASCTKLQESCPEIFGGEVDGDDNTPLPLPDEGDEDAPPPIPAESF